MRIIIFAFRGYLFSRMEIKIKNYNITKEKNLNILTKNGFLITDLKEISVSDRAGLVSFAFSWKMAKIL